VVFFAWSAVLCKILTVDNLRKRYIIIVDRCCLCKRNGESVDCLLLHCNAASSLWNTLFTLFGMSWVMPRRVIDLFTCLWNFGRPKSAAIWKIVPICIFWCVWKEINLRCFEDLESSMEDILASFFSYFVSLDGSFCVCPLCRLVLAIFLFVFRFIVRCFLLYTSGVLIGYL
jgi:hypothetical protein